MVEVLGPMRGHVANVCFHLQTPLHDAAFCGMADVVRVLIELKDRLGEPVACGTQYNPMVAVACGCSSMRRFLPLQSTNSDSSKSIDHFLLTGYRELRTIS